MFRIGEVTILTSCKKKKNDKSFRIAFLGSKKIKEIDPLPFQLVEVLFFFFFYR